MPIISTHIVLKEEGDRRGREGGGGGRGEKREGDKEKEREKKREDGVPCLRGVKEERWRICGQTDMDREAEAETERND